MKRVTIAIIIIVIAIMLSGCVLGPSHFKKVVRVYNHSAPDNITINVEGSYNPIIVTTNTSDIKIVECLEIKESILLPSRENTYCGYLSDYVRFYGDERNLSADIWMVNIVGEYRVENANLTVYLPEYSNYTINTEHTDIHTILEDQSPYVIYYK